MDSHNGVLAVVNKVRYDGRIVLDIISSEATEVDHLKPKVISSCGKVYVIIVLDVSLVMQIVYRGDAQGGGLVFVPGCLKSTCYVIVPDELHHSEGSKAAIGDGGMCVDTAKDEPLAVVVVVVFELNGGVTVMACVDSSENVDTEID